MSWTNVGLGALRVLEAIRISGLEKKTRYYQASSSELFGEVQETPQRETDLTYIIPGEQDDTDEDIPADGAINS